MNRYESINKTSNGKKPAYETIIYPQIESSDDDDIVEMKSTDRLDLLAHIYYNDASLWWIIALANDLDNPSVYVDSGTIIRVPKNISSYQQNTKDLNP